MVSQAEEFKELVSAMVNMGCMVTVYGEGMLQAVAEEMSKLLTEIDGLYWPAADQETRAAVTSTLPDVHKFVQFCPKRGIAVQAGGNVGVFPKELARHFKQVITFEPDAVNWECFQRNVTEPNIIGRKMALGDAPGRMAVEHNAFNPGASYLTAGNDVEVITLDSLDLEGCDLLQLDVEGFELKALKGAEATIRKYSPVIVLEQKGLGEKYGDSDSATTEWLTKIGYRKADAIHRDVIYVRTH
jgi:FkbM family methyltransferase